MTDGIFSQQEVASLISVYEGIVYQKETELETAKGILQKLRLKMVTQLAVPSYTQEHATPVSAWSNSVGSDYNTKWNWPKKVEHVISQAGICLTTRQIINGIKAIEPMDTDPVASVSGTISGKIKAGVIFNRYAEYEGGDWFIGLKDWFNPDGSVKEERRGKL